MNQRQIKERAGHVVDLVADLSVQEALKVLHEASGRILRQAGAEPPLAAPAVPIPYQLLERRRGGRSKITGNPEVRDFIHGLPKGLSFTAMARRCREEFGPDLAPSKSAIHRYIQRLRNATRIGEKQ